MRMGTIAKSSRFIVFTGVAAVVKLVEANAAAHHGTAAVLGDRQ